MPQAQRSTTLYLLIANCLRFLEKGSTLLEVQQKKKRKKKKDLREGKKIEDKVEQD